MQESPETDGTNNPKKEQNQQQINYESEEQIPDHFYDSDIASVNEKDFLSDNQPPKDIVYERKLLYKQKFRHIYKTIIKVGSGIDKPAPYDLIKLRFRSKMLDKVKGPSIKTRNKKRKQQLNKPKAQEKDKDKDIKIEETKNEEQIDLLSDIRSVSFLDGVQFLSYNLGIENPQIQTLVISMKKSEIAMFQVQELELSQKTNIKILKEKYAYIIEVDKWTTVIDIDNDRKLFKYIMQNGKGPHRVHKFDQVTFQYEITNKEQKHTISQSFNELRIEEEQIQALPVVVWKILSSMKQHQISEVSVNQTVLQQIQKQKFKKIADKLGIIRQDDSKQISEVKSKSNFKIRVQVNKITKIDDFYMDGSVLKKLLIKGVSTAKPESSSLVYYALEFMDQNKKVLQTDKCFKSDWWEDYGKLDELGCRKNYLDEYKISKFLKASIKRMKPAEVSELQCRDMQLFRYGEDYEQLKSLYPKDLQFPPKKVYLTVRVYNFTQPKTCFNIDIQEKVLQARRKKVVAINLLQKQGNIKKAFKRFQNIVSLFSSGDINQEAYDEKVSSLMNSILCLMKQQKYSQMIPLCDVVLQSPKHGYNQDKMKINGPEGIKIEGKVKSQNPLDDRDAADLKQNTKILDKCLYRKALALTKIGQSKEALDCLGKIEQESEQVKKLRLDALDLQQKYEQKSKKMFKNMFG